MVDDYMFNITSNSDIRLENQTYSDANHFRDYSENSNNKTAIYNMLSSMHTMSLEQLRSIKFLQIGQKSDTVMSDKVTDFLTFKAHHNEIDLDTEFIIEVKRDVDVVTRSGASNENLNKNTYTGFKGGKYYPEIELRFMKNQQTGLYELHKDGVVMFGVYETTNEKDGINWVWPPELKYYSFITQENINGNPSNRNLPFTPMNWETQNFNTRTNILHKIHKYKENRNLIETEEMNMIYIPYIQTTSTQGIFNEYKKIDESQFFVNPVLSSEREFSLEEIRSFRFFEFAYEDEYKNTYYNHIKLRRTEHNEDEITIETINENGFNEIPTIDGRFNNRNGGTMDAKQPFEFMILFEKQPNGKYKIHDDIKRINSSSEDFNNKLRDDDRINRMSVFNYFTIITQSDVDTDPGISINGTTTPRSRNLNTVSYTYTTTDFNTNEDIITKYNQTNKNNVVIDRNMNLNRVDNSNFDKTGLNRFSNGVELRDLKYLSFGYIKDLENTPITNTYDKGINHLYDIVTHQMNFKIKVTETNNQFIIQSVDGSNTSRFENGGVDYIDGNYTLTLRLVYDKTSNGVVLNRSASTFILNKSNNQLPTPTLIHFIKKTEMFRDLNFRSMYEKQKNINKYELSHYTLNSVVYLDKDPRNNVLFSQYKPNFGKVHKYLTQHQILNITSITLAQVNESSKTVNRELNVNLNVRNLSNKIVLSSNDSNNTISLVYTLKNGMYVFNEKESNFNLNTNNNIYNYVKFNVNTNTDINLQKNQPSKEISGTFETTFNLKDKIELENSVSGRVDVEDVVENIETNNQEIYNYFDRLGFSSNSQYNGLTLSDIRSFKMIQLGLEEEYTGSMHFERVESTNTITIRNVRNNSQTMNSFIVSRVGELNPNRADQTQGDFAFNFVFKKQPNGLYKIDRATSYYQVSNFRSTNLKFTIITYNQANRNRIPDGDFNENNSTKQYYFEAKSNGFERNKDGYERVYNPDNNAIGYDPDRYLERFDNGGFGGSGYYGY